MFVVRAGNTVLESSSYLDSFLLLYFVANVLWIIYNDNSIFYV